MVNIRYSFFGFIVLFKCISNFVVLQKNSGGTFLIIEFPKDIYPKVGVSSWCNG